MSAPSRARCGACQRRDSVASHEIHLGEFLITNDYGLGEFLITNETHDHEWVGRDPDLCLERRHAWDATRLPAAAAAATTTTDR